MPRVSHNVGMPAGPLWRTIIEGGAHHSPLGNQTCWYMLNFSIKSKQFCEENKNWMRLKLWTAKYARSEWLFEELDQWRNVNEGENVKRHTLPYWWEHVHRDVDQMPLRVKAALKKWKCRRTEVWKKTHWRREKGRKLPKCIVNGEMRRTLKESVGF